MCIWRATVTQYCHPRSFRHIQEDTESCLRRNKRCASGTDSHTPHTHTHTHTTHTRTQTQIPMALKRRWPRNQPQGFPAMVILQHLHEGQSQVSLGALHLSLSFSIPGLPGYYWANKDLYHPSPDIHMPCLRSWPRDPQPREN